MRTRKSKILFTAFIILFSALIVQGIRGFLIFSITDWIAEDVSVQHLTGSIVKYPLRGTSFYPNLLTFNNDTGASHALGIPVSFTVDYSFAKPTFLLGRSTVMNPKHPYYGSFIGCYWVMGADHKLSSSELASLVSFDIQKMMLPSFGASSCNTFCSIGPTVEDESLCQISTLKFSRKVSQILMSTPAHPFKFQSSYLLYGFPARTSDSYLIKTMYGVLYDTYIKDLDLNLMLYATAKDFSTLEQIDTQILQRATIQIGQK